MKILVINNLFEERHIEQIKKGAEEAGAQVHFYTSDKDIPQSDYDSLADVTYGNTGIEYNHLREANR